MAITNLDHVVVAVNDLEAATRVWQGNFGLPLAQTGENQALGIKQAILPIGTAFIELIAPLSATGPVAETLAGKGEGLYLLSLAVDDLETTLADLRARGVRVSDPPPGSRVTFISPRVAHGVLVQLVERKEGQG